MDRRRGETVAIYERVTAIIFQRLGPTFGQRTIAAIAKNVVTRQAKQHRLLGFLAVSEQGVNWSDFKAHLGDVPEEEVAASLEGFLDEFFEALSNLIGRLILGQVFKEAEEAVKGGDEQ